MFAQTIRPNISPAEQTELRQLCLITDGNAHRPDLLRTADISSGHADVVSEALLPEIRSTAMLIAASRHDWNTPTPDVFADEADWFAARILLLNIRFVHLHTSLAPMLQLANSRGTKPPAVHCGQNSPQPAQQTPRTRAADGLRPARRTANPLDCQKFRITAIIG